eukprot:m.85913 g.85913  ORF g.85913 m.85913 type:complete len:145 (+) comp8258_c0_seq2:2842-3276(+)
MSDFVVTEQEIAKFEEAFFTRPGDGTLTLERLKKLSDSLGLRLSDSELQAMLKQLGPKSYDFKLLLNTFASKFKPVDSDEELRIAFDAFDTDKSGSVSISELRTMMGKLEDRPSQEDLEALLRALDSNGDGQISFKEFLSFMKA